MYRKYNLLDFIRVLFVNCDLDSLSTLSLQVLMTESANPVDILEQSKCGASKLVRFDNLGYATGSDTGGGGSTPRILLTLARLYGPVTSFSGVYTLYSPSIITLQVGGNPLMRISESELLVNLGLSLILIIHLYFSSPEPNPSSPVVHPSV